MAILPAEPKSRRNALILIGITVVAIWYALQSYLLKPRAEEVSRLEERLELLDGRNRRARAEVARRDDLRARLEIQERQLRIFEEFIPQSEEVPELLDAISQQARMTGVEWSRIRPQADQPGQFYTKQTWEIAVTGEYHDIGRFLARIASLPRIIKPGNVQIAPAAASRATRDMETPLEVSFIVETFVLGATASTPTTQGASPSG